MEFEKTQAGNPHLSLPGPSRGWGYQMLLGNWKIRDTPRETTSNIILPPNGKLRKSSPQKCGLHGTGYGIVFVEGYPQNVRPSVCTTCYL